MNIITYQDFHNIRLSDFYAGDDIREIDNYEFMGEQWIGELSGFNTCLRLISSPDETRAISLDFTKDDAGLAEKALTVLQLPLKRSCTERDLAELFGEPQKKLRLAKDTMTLDYVIGEKCSYYLSCTLHHINGLMYLDMIHEDKVIRKMKGKEKKKVMEE